MTVAPKSWCLFACFKLNDDKRIFILKLQSGVFCTIFRADPSSFILKSFCLWCSGHPKFLLCFFFSSSYVTIFFDFFPGFCGDQEKKLLFLYFLTTLILINHTFLTFTHSSFILCRAVSHDTRLKACFWDHLANAKDVRLTGSAWF